jgi:diguanylate cyclase (GGDEF)-like protein
VLNARDVTERVQLEEELTRQAFHDGLTDLANRALFRDRLDQPSRGRSAPAWMCVLLIDLDGFKQVNDTLGHDAGDRLLQEVGRRFGEVIRAGDTLARLGGDEFALLLEDAKELVAIGLAERLPERLSDPVSVADHQLTLGASIGIVAHRGRGSSDDLIRHADVAMYAAKEAGRGRYELYEDGMARELGELLGLEHELRLGLKRGQFAVNYQPLVDLAADAVVGVEARLRWHSQSRGVVPPDRFIPVDKSDGSRSRISASSCSRRPAGNGRWEQADSCPRSSRPGSTCPASSCPPVACPTVRAALHDAGLPAECLGLEVTETALVEEGTGGARARAELQQLHDEGVRIAIDDFGTGFSSLGQLRSFPVDMIKVDRSFVQGVEDEAKDAAITANLVTLAHALGLQAIAEGIESDSQLASLRALGCDLAQGYLFARPLPEAGLARLHAGADRRPGADDPRAGRRDPRRRGRAGPLTSRHGGGARPRRLAG